MLTTQTAEPFTLSPASPLAMEPFRLPAPAPFTLSLTPKSLISHKITGTGEAYDILEGAVCISRTFKDGRRQILDILGPGRLLDMTAASSDRIESLTHVRLRRVASHRIDSRRAADRTEALERMQRLVTVVGRMTAEERLATALLDLSRQFKVESETAPEGSHSFLLPLTRAELADWLGLVLETVSRAMTQLQKRGILRLEPKQHLVHILNPEALASPVKGG